MRDDVSTEKESLGRWMVGVAVAVTAAMAVVASIVALVHTAAATA